MAKNAALPQALGKYVVFLDDDSFPRPGSIGRMIAHFEADETLGAATFTVTLPDGTRECSALSRRLHRMRRRTATPGRCD